MKLKFYSSILVCFLGMICGGANALLGQTIDCEELFISEYVDGSGKNKAVEIYNPSESTVNLAGYSVQVYHNGAPSPIRIELAGLLEPHKVHVLANPLADGAILGKAHQTSVKYNPNGDDAISLQKDGANLDVIGEIGVNPGNQGWAVPAENRPTATTKSFTMVRKAACKGGQTAWSICQAEWMAYPEDDILSLGSHGSLCSTNPTVSFSLPSSGCMENGCGGVLVQIQLSHTPAVNSPVFVDFGSLSAPSANQATPGVDVQDPRTISPTSFYSGDPLSQFVQISVFPDTDVEPDEVLRMELRVTGQGSAGSQFYHDLNILNDDVVGIEDEITESQFSLFPVPASKNVTVSWKSPKLTKKLMIYDSKGKKMYELLAPVQESLVLEIESWPAGIYHATILQQDGTYFTKHLVKN